MQIQYLTNNEIDRAKWDECIASANNGLIYAQTFYLNSLAKGWNALVAADYSWVLPITFNKKYGIRYLYQPPFIQQLGIFSKRGAIVPYAEILHWLQQHYNFWEINWNHTTPANLKIAGLDIHPATNFILKLQPKYDEIARLYHTDLIKNLKKSRRSKLHYQSRSNFEKYMHLYVIHYGKRTPHVKKSHYKKFWRMCALALQNGSLICRQAVDESGNVLSAAILLFDGKRLYNIMNTTTEAGRLTAANHFLLDAVIREFAGRDLIFDFEGSDLPGVKSFYENFGAVNQPYFMLKYNKLAWPFKLFKH